MILINLLPYREQEREKKQKEFARTIGLAALLGVVVSGVTYYFLMQKIEEQQARNQTLNTAISKAQEDGQKVEALKKEKEQLLAKKQKVEALQQKRGLSAKMMDKIAEALPKGVYLTSVTPEGGAGTQDMYSIVGNAASDNRIAEFMIMLPQTGMFNAPSLASIRKMTNAQEFKLSLELLPPGSVPQTLTDEEVAVMLANARKIEKELEAANEEVESASAPVELPNAEVSEKVGE